MELTLARKDPNKYDLVLKIAYLTLIVLNVVFPLLEASFVTIGDLNKGTEKSVLIVKQLS